MSISRTNAVTVARLLASRPVVSHPTPLVRSLSRAASTSSTASTSCTLLATPHRIEHAEHLAHANLTPCFSPSLPSNSTTDVAKVPRAASIATIVWPARLDPDHLRRSHPWSELLCDHRSRTDRSHPWPRACICVSFVSGRVAETPRDDRIVGEGQASVCFFRITRFLSSESTGVKEANSETDSSRGLSSDSDTESRPWPASRSAGSRDLSSEPVCGG